MSNEKLSRNSSLLASLGLTPQLIPGYVLGFSVLIAAWYNAAAIVPTYNIAVTRYAGLLAGALGWLFGLALTPVDEKEDAIFGRAGATITTLIGGVVLGQVYEVLSKTITNAPHWGDPTWGRIVYVGLFFVVGMLFTLIHRLVHIGQKKARSGSKEASKEVDG